MIHQVIKKSEQDLAKTLERQSLLEQRVRYKLIRGIEHYKSMPETFVEQNRTYQKTSSIHQFLGHDDLFAVYILINK